MQQQALMAVIKPNERMLKPYRLMNVCKRLKYWLINVLIAGWSKGANDNLRVLVNSAFEVDQEGKISITKVPSLRQYKIDDPEWLRAMDAISDSLRANGSKSYVRIYKRVGNGDKYEPISLDIASA